MNKTDRRKHRRRKIFANKIHRELFFLAFLASILPAIIVASSLYYLIFGIVAQQFGIPEVIAYNIIPAARKVLAILLVAAPASILIILFCVYKITHKIVGPFDRIIRELDEYIEGKKQDHIIVRKSDKFWPLVEKINKLLDKVNREI